MNDAHDKRAPAQYPAHYPGYDVLAKRDTPSWNPITRQVIDARLRIAEAAPRYLDGRRYAVLCALCLRIVPQPPARDARVPTAALVDERLAHDEGDGYRDSRLPALRTAWLAGLAALDTAAQATHGRGFAELDADAADALLHAIERGEPSGADWGGMDPKVFFAKRALMDIGCAYYGHPYAWNEIGFGGPASPRGYVRMDFNRRDPWEAPAAIGEEGVDGS